MAREDEIRRKKEGLRKLQEAEQERVNELLHHTASWKRSREVRDYLDALCYSLVGPDSPVPIDGKLAEYLKWGFQQADRMDPLKDSPHSILDEEIEDSVSRAWNVPNCLRRLVRRAGSSISSALRLLK